MGALVDKGFDKEKISAFQQAGLAVKKVADDTSRDEVPQKMEEAAAATAAATLEGERMQARLQQQHESFHGELRLADVDLEDDMLFAGIPKTDRKALADRMRERFVQGAEERRKAAAPY